MTSDVAVQNICILGSTGSIGVNTLDVIARHPERFRAFAVTGYQNDKDLFKQCLVHKPAFAVLVDALAAERLKNALTEAGSSTEVLSGKEALCFVAGHEQVDVVMAAIVGAAGLAPNLAAAKSGKKILLANKESLVMSGELFMSEVAASGSVLLPIDSEHNAIFQCLPSQTQCGDALGKEIRRVLLTASGGPFRNYSLSELEGVTPEQACAHPNWSMGQKISVDSASLMNKGLELIEACWLFDISPDRIDVHVHPESIIHSMVEYVDGSVLAQMGNPDMRTPIAYGLGWPDRLESGVDSLDLFSVAQLNFERPDLTRFPCLALAQEAFQMGGTACALLNAANERAVDAFLKGNISFVSIPDIIGHVLNSVVVSPADSIETVMEADQIARQAADAYIFSIAKS